MHADIDGHDWVEKPTELDISLVVVLRYEIREAQRRIEQYHGCDLVENFKVLKQWRLERDRREQVDGLDHSHKHQQEDEKAWPFIAHLES